MKYNKNLLNVLKLNKNTLKTGIKLAVIIPGTTNNNKPLIRNSKDYDQPLAFAGLCTI